MANNFIEPVIECKTTSNDGKEWLHRQPFKGAATVETFEKLWCGDKKSTALGALPLRIATFNGTYKSEMNAMKQRCKCIVIEGKDLSFNEKNLSNPSISFSSNKRRKR